MQPLHPELRSGSVFFCEILLDIVILNRGLTVINHVHLLRNDIHSSHLMVLAQQSCNGQANVTP